MKLIIALFVFFLTLSLTYKISANEAETCSMTANESCAEHGEKGEHNELSAKMNSLFPEKQKDLQVSERPLQVNLKTPKFLAVISDPSVKLIWSQGVGATSYHLQVATDPNFKWLVINDYWVKEPSYQMTNLEPNKRYFWRVASVNESNISMRTKSLFVSSAFDTK